MEWESTNTKPDTIKGGNKMTFWILLAIAGFLTLLSLKHYNIIFSFAGTLGWMAVWGYNLDHPPSNVVVGTFVYDLLYYTFIIVAIAVMLIYFRNRSRQTSGSGGGNVERGETSVRAIREGGAMSESAEEYRMRVRRALHPNRRRR